MAISIEDVMRRIPDWQGRALSISPLSGGLTNTNYRVEVDGKPYVVRIPGANTELLAVDRANEVHNTRAAAQAGTGPRVIHYLADESVMVLEYITGQTMSIAALQAPGMPARMGQTLRRLHAGPRFLTDFNMFRLVTFYLGIVDGHAVRIPDGYRDYLGRVAQIESALARRPLPSVPCHNDLLAENYIDDGQALWLIDFEYSGNNDPTFELGNTSQEQQFDEARQAELCAAYFGAAEPHLLARMALQMIMSDVGWTLWAAIQAQISTIDFDFWGWTVERWTRASSKMDSDAFGKWLDTV